MKWTNEQIAEVLKRQLDRVEEYDIDLIYVEADECFYIMPRLSGKPESLLEIYNLTQRGTSGLSNALGVIPQNDMMEFIKSKMVLMPPKYQQF